MFDFAGANPESQCAEGAVSGRVAIAADDRHARLGQAQLGANDVHDALPRIVEIVQPNAELPAILAERVDLLLRDGVGNRQPPIGGRNIVVRRGRGQLGPADFAPAQAQALEGLGAGDLVDQVAVDVEDRLLAGLGVHDVVVPDFGEHGSQGRLSSHRRGICSENMGEC